MKVITMVTDQATEAEHTQERVDTAADFLYAAECAFHDAHQTHVDAWITAAADKLHDAVSAHLAAVVASHAASTPRLSY
jgi:hypothetical protein